MTNQRTRAAYRRRSALDRLNAENAARAAERDAVARDVEALEEGHAAALRRAPEPETGNGSVHEAAATRKTLRDSKAALVARRDARLAAARAEEQRLVEAKARVAVRQHNLPAPEGDVLENLVADFASPEGVKKQEARLQELLATRDERPDSAGAILREASARVLGGAPLPALPVEAEEADDWSAQELLDAWLAGP